MSAHPPSDTASWVGPRGEQPSFPRRGRRGALLSAAIGLGSGLVLVGVGLLGHHDLAPVQLAVGCFASTMGTFGLLSARRARVCASCGRAPAVAHARLPLEAAEELIRAIELVDPDRIARIVAPTGGEATLRLELLHCPRCRDLGWLRATARIEGVPMRVGSTWVILEPFLGEVLEELTRR